MCDSYRDNPDLSKDANAILRVLACQENRRQLGHCVVYSQKDGRWNVPGYYGRPPEQGVVRVED